MKKTLLVLVLALLGMTAMAKPVDPAAAQRVAANFWNAHRDNGVAAVTSPMQQVNIPFDGMYLFKAGERGFVFVAADDCVQPILGYSFTSPAGDRLNREVSYWLGTFQQQIDWMRSNGIEGSSETAAMWTLYATAPDSDPEPLTAVTPLLSTTWDQSPYYNNLCPYDNTYNDRTVTGCVATATAQVMKYWNHPDRGTGMHSYTHATYGTQSANFAATTYDWTHMPNALTASSSTTQKTAVATLMYHVGVAIEMDYGPSATGGSAAYTNNYGSPTLPCTQNALSMYFGYLPITNYTRDNYTDAAWASYINTELNASRPVIYAGSDTAGGHCFVCDGYNNSNMYHFNWGWGGWQDGYYALSNLAPGSGGTGGNATYTFNLNQRILTGVQPDPNYTSTNPLAPDPNCLISSFPYTENFDDTNTYSCLRIYDANADGESWSLIDSFGTNYSTAAYISYAVNANDFLILPGITTPGNYTISWKARIYSSSYPETYQVMAGDDVVFSETLSSTSLVSRSASFSVSAGDTVLPMFNYISDDMYAFFIDDITIEIDTVGPIDTCIITSFPYTENFDNAATYGCLTVYDANDDGTTWGLTLNQGVDSSICAYIPYAVNADDYLSLPSIVTPGNYTITWKVRIMSTNYPETYQVLAGNTVIFNETLTSTSYVTKNATFSVAAGDTVKIRFRYMSDDMYYLFLDDITISQGTTPPAQYTITVASNNSAWGTVSGGGTYNSGATATLTATANSGYHFVQWQDAVTTNPRTITVTGNATYTATFAANSPTPGTSDTISWCDTNSIATSVGAGGSLYWGISLTPSQLSGHNYLKSVMLMVAYGGTYTLRIHTGGTTAPGTLAHTQTVVFSDSQLGWQEIMLDNTFPINASQNLWITFYNNDVQYPATACVYVGNTNSDWASVDDAAWDHLQNLSSTLTYSWLIKAVTSQNAGPLPAPTVSISGPTTTATGVAQTFNAVASGSATVTWSLAGATPSTATGNSATATWYNPGTYNIVATATNSYGVGHDTLTINVINCGTVSTFPYTLGFEDNDISQFACWTVLDADNDGYSWDINVFPGTIASASYINNIGALTPDNWLISPQMQFTSGSNYTLSWKTAAPDSNYFAEHYGVYVSTTGTATSNFSLVQQYTLNTHQVTTHTLDLSAYAGQTIYIAFRHWNVTDEYWMTLDDISITQTAIPGQNYTITVQSANPAMGSVSGGGTFTAGATTTISATANNGYHFTSWNDGNTSNPRTITVTGNATYIANFESDAPTQYTITVQSANPTMGSVSGGGTYNEGATVTISATAFNGYHFTSWNDGNTNATRTITVTGNATYTANFEANPTQTYTITVRANNDAWGSVSGGGTFNEGATVTISATAYSGYQFTSWNDGNTSNPRTITVTGNATYIANFEPTTGIEGIDSDNWSIYPNPAANMVTVTCVDQAMVIVTDMTGRNVASYTVADGNNTIDVSTLTSGAYFLRITSNGTSAVRKLIIK